MPDNEIENISNKCQKSEASERKIMYRKENRMEKKIVTCFENHGTNPLKHWLFICSQFSTIATAFIYLVWKFEFEYIAIRFVHTILVLCAAAAAETQKAIENAIVR